MPQVGIEPMTPSFELANIVYALDRAATVIGHVHHIRYIIDMLVLKTNLM
jgi:hypothetical protein